MTGMASYRHPRTGLTQSLGLGSVAAALFTGPIWYFAKGAHAIGFAYLTGLATLAVVGLGQWATVLHLGMALAAPLLQGGRLQRLGWSRTDPG